MNPNQLESAALAGSTPAPSAHLSMLDLFFHADWVVQLVMLLLLAASFWCWTIIFAKVMKLRALKHQADTFEEAFWSGGSLEHLYDRMGMQPKDPLSAIFASAMREWKRSSSKGRLVNPEIRTTLQQRIDRVMNATLSREMEDVESQMIFLASVGSTAPFIGLFGTVWGIMHSFQSIAASQSTNLAVVAPGIAEALFATALGLVAAIPAVLAYNKLSTEIDHYAGRLDSFCHEFSTLISRQLEGTE